MHHLLGIDIQEAIALFPNLCRLQVTCDVYQNNILAASFWPAYDHAERDFRLLQLDIPSADLYPLLAALPLRLVGCISLEWAPLNVPYILRDFDNVQVIAVLPCSVSLNGFWNVILRNAHGQDRIFRRVPQGETLMMVRETACAEVTLPIQLLACTRLPEHLRKLTLLLGYSTPPFTPVALQLSAEPWRLRSLTVDELVLSARIPAEVRAAVPEDVFIESAARYLRMQSSALDTVITTWLPSCANQPRTLVGIQAI
ncbi:hypothetical protein EXIGLDRAFT_729116 [Exidia glandulosa HHB12029]|uniref:Uncharacterized protein n=1 Tax=Exidia glandulosa HHB12029 TaxID=1314781 RepID=A0A165CQK6_EXIGL|nr:hypothetical protein EXIGLDRAFT_729116 [Exidia glandulosa HHB12029]